MKQPMDMRTTEFIEKSDDESKNMMQHKKKSKKSSRQKEIRKHFREQKLEMLQHGFESLLSQKMTIFCLSSQEEGKTNCSKTKLKQPH